MRAGYRQTREVCGRMRGVSKPRREGLRENARGFQAAALKDNARVGQVMSRRAWGKCARVTGSGAEAWG